MYFYHEKTNKFTYLLSQLNKTESGNPPDTYCREVKSRHPVRCRAEFAGKSSKSWNGPSRFVSGEGWWLWSTRGDGSWWRCLSWKKTSEVSLCLGRLTALKQRRQHSCWFSYFYCRCRGSGNTCRLGGYTRRFCRRTDRWLEKRWCWRNISWTVPGDFPGFSACNVGGLLASMVGGQWRWRFGTFLQHVTQIFDWHDLRCWQVLCK